MDWQEYRIGDLFESSNGDFDIQASHINGRGDYVVSSGETNSGIIGKTDVPAKVFDANTITIDMFGTPFFRSYSYKMVTHARVFSMKMKNHHLSNLTGNYFVATLNYIKKIHSYSDMASFNKIKDYKIILPTHNNEIAFDYIVEFVNTLEVERLATLEAYLFATGLKNTEFTLEERSALDILEADSVSWKVFNLKELFGSATRGKRLKSADRIVGNLPFVTAGETNMGISDFIGNKVQVFSENTVTIDMFGSAKYRNYIYGADDHVAVIHTENLDKFSSLFITSSIHKSAHAGQFDYSRNFYAADADNLMISLPVKEDGTIDYDFMTNLMSAIQKHVIKDVVKYLYNRIEATNQIIKES